MAFLTAGMVWAGQWWMASSWSLASVSLTMTPGEGLLASGPFLVTSLNPSMMSPRLVEVLDTLGVVDEDVGAADGVTFLIRSLLRPYAANLSPTSLASLFLTVPSPNSPSSWPG